MISVRSHICANSIHMNYQRNLKYMKSETNRSRYAHLQDKSNEQDKRVRYIIDFKHEISIRLFEIGL
jgi:hypothetical protein